MDTRNATPAAPGPEIAISIAVDARAELGEGPLWDPARACLWFVDIMRGGVHRFDPASGEDRVYQIGQPVGAVALSRRGFLLCAVRDGFARLEPDSGVVTPWIAIEADNSRNRMNDGYVDARGRFWAGTMSMHGERGQGALYCLHADGIVTQMLTGVTTSNGIDWNAASTLMYYVDTGEPRIDLFDFDVDRGRIRNRRPFVDIDPAAGKPDGLIVDADDHVWVALWKGGAVRRYAPDGTLVQTVALPAPLTTKPAFGGADLGDLYVTSAFTGLSDAERAAAPAAGSVFRLRPGARGKAPGMFG